MRIRDSSNFAVHPDLEKANIQKVALIYMVDCFPTNSNRVFVDVEHVRALGAELRQKGIKRVIFDIEPTTNPETRFWLPNKPEYVAQFNAGWYTFMSSIRSGYGKGGNFGIYDGHADWMDFQQFLQTRGWTPETEAKWKYFNDWEAAIRPTMRLMDTCYPSVYGFWHQFVPGVGGGYVNNGFTLDQYKSFSAEAYKNIYAAIKHYHGYKKPIEWFVTTNLGGEPFPAGTLDWQLEQLGKFKGAVVMWNHSDYQPSGWDDYNIGVMAGHAK